MAVQTLSNSNSNFKGLVASVVLHAALLLFLLFYTWNNIPIKEKEMAEVFIDIESLEQKPQTQESALIQEEEKDDHNLESENAAKGAEASKKSILSNPNPAAKTNKATADSKSPATQKLTDKNSDIAAAEAKAKIEKANAEAAIAKAKEEERIKKEKEAKARTEAEANKKKYSGLFGNKEKEGSGGTEKEGSGGDPNSKNLDGLVKGNGKIGEGLVGRGVLKEPKISDKSQKAGKVVVRVCVDASGKVIEAKFTQKGSTTTDSHLVKIAEEGARKYQFSNSDLEKQCGTITIDFILN
jgi:outer membrane biosynthesis protein TonB